MSIVIDENGRREVSEEEALSIIKQIGNRWSKEAHIAEINLLHNELFAEILSKYNYISMSELALWAQSSNENYYDEANAILNWYTSTYMQIELYASSVTQPNAIEPQIFIGSLPKFSFGL